MEATNQPHGIVLQSLNQFAQIDIPGASYTVVTGINNSKLVTGYYGSRITIKLPSSRA